MRECERLGVTRLGITDHLNSLDKADLHLDIKRDIESLNGGPEIFFGVELNFTEVDGCFPFSEKVKDQYGFQFATGGIHSTYLDSYDRKTLVDIQHLHHLKTCRDPLVDVLVHPYWFAKGGFDTNGWPWFDSMKAVPKSYARELGQTARETGTSIEINACANLENKAYSHRQVEEYVEFLSILSEEGANFALGSDAHDIGRLRAVESAWKVAGQLNLEADRLWRPPCEPLVG